nr:hypothetical protein [Metallosphaera yellowstonensis]
MQKDESDREDVSSVAFESKESHDPSTVICGLLRAKSLHSIMIEHKAIEIRDKLPNPPPVLICNTFYGE